MRTIKHQAISHFPFYLQPPLSTSARWIPIIATPCNCLHRVCQKQQQARSVSVSFASPRAESLRTAITELGCEQSHLTKMRCGSKTPDHQSTPGPSSSPKGNPPRRHIDLASLLLIAGISSRYLHLARPARAIRLGLTTVRMSVFSLPVQSCSMTDRPSPLNLAFHWFPNVLYCSMPGRCLVSRSHYFRIGILLFLPPFFPAALALITEDCLIFILFPRILGKTT